MKVNKQTEILEFIYFKIENEGYSPSIREIAEKVNLKSTSFTCRPVGMWHPTNGLEGPSASGCLISQPCRPHSKIYRRHW